VYRPAHSCPWPTKRNSNYGINADFTGLEKNLQVDVESLTLFALRVLDGTGKLFEAPALHNRLHLMEELVMDQPIRSQKFAACRKIEPAAVEMRNPSSSFLHE
jgi:hypothetical protein